MKSFKYSYQADLKRYNGNADTYIRIWLFLYRKCCYCKTPILKTLYKVAFRDCGQTEEDWKSVLQILSGRVFI